MSYRDELVIRPEILHIGFREPEDIDYLRQVAEKKILGLIVCYGDGTITDPALAFVEHELSKVNGYELAVNDAVDQACAARLDNLDVEPDPYFTRTIGTMTTEHALSEIDYINKKSRVA
jgi:hypothetical protein